MLEKLPNLHSPTRHVGTVCVNGIVKTLHYRNNDRIHEIMVRIEKLLLIARNGIKYFSEIIRTNAVKSNAEFLHSRARVGRIAIFNTVVTKNVVIAKSGQNFRFQTAVAEILFAENIGSTWCIYTRRIRLMNCNTRDEIDRYYYRIFATTFDIEVIRVNEIYLFHVQPPMLMIWYILYLQRLAKIFLYRNSSSIRKYYEPYEVESVHGFPSNGNFHYFAE